MNVKIHTPKSLKAGSGMSSLKQFMLSLLATTVSIALTFGTAAIVDNNKKQREKHEIVMMVMYDMYNSLAPVEKADSMIHQLIDMQEKLAKDPTLYNFDMKIRMYNMLPNVQFTETTEKIFSSTIETINTVGNVLFTENVAKFYQARKSYKTEICDSLSKNVRSNYAFNTLNDATDAILFDYALMSSYLKYDMQQLFAQCKQMMGISDEELDVYRQERARTEKNSSTKNDYLDSVSNAVVEQQKRIIDAREKWIK